MENYNIEIILKIINIHEIKCCFYPNRPADTISKLKEFLDFWAVKIVIIMSTGIVKKARGRPPKSSVPSKTSDIFYVKLKKKKNNNILEIFTWNWFLPAIKQEVESLESNRQYDSGRASMSLRPNKRVRLTKVWNK